MSKANHSLILVSAANHYPCPKARSLFYSILLKTNSTSNNSKNLSDSPSITPQIGIPFWNGKCRALLEWLNQHGGLLVVPSGPNLTDCRHDTIYKQALHTADAAVMDSGYLALILRMKGEREFQRISGLQILEVLLNHPNGGKTESILATAPTLWVVPNVDEETRIQNYLTQHNFDLSHHDFYRAPYYEASLSQPIEDRSLLEHIKETEPQWVVLCVAGGKQEKLGLYLRNELRMENSEWPMANGEEVGTDASCGGAKLQSEACGSSKLEGEACGSPNIQTDPSPIAPSLRHKPAPKLPSILCTGAAIAFLTGGQATIPKWADRLYLGWLFRILQSPSKYFYRYLQAARLPFVLRAWRS